MATWAELLDGLESQPDDISKKNWIDSTLKESLETLCRLRNGRNLILYSSAFLQKNVPNQGLISINPEDMNGFMATIRGLDCDKGLTLLLHTPGGVTNAAETIVEYLRSKFPYIEVIIPLYAMSAGTMISLAADRIIMGRQSQLGPIDPQLPLNGRMVSAIAVIQQFQRAQKEILGDKGNAMVWGPLLSSIGPNLLQESQNSIAYSEAIVARWLEKYMLNGSPEAKVQAKKIAHYFSKGSDKVNHGRRIDREEARSQGVLIQDLEEEQELQDAALTLYHLLTLLFEKTPLTKIIINHLGAAWVKNTPLAMNPVQPNNPGRSDNILD